MSSRSAYVDTAILAYALGGAHPLKRYCVDIIAAAGGGRLELHASVEVIQELLFHRMRRGDRAAALRQARDAATLCLLHDFDVAVLRQSIELVGSQPRLGGRDAVHAATALISGIGVIISPDAAFDQIEGLRRVSPEQVAEGPGADL